jgi:hypothetical protein
LAGTLAAMTSKGIAWTVLPTPGRAWGNRNSRLEQSEGGTYRQSPTRTGLLRRERGPELVWEFADAWTRAVDAQRG